MLSGNEFFSFSDTLKYILDSLDGVGVVSPLEFEDALTNVTATFRDCALNTCSDLLHLILDLPPPGILVASKLFFSFDVWKERYSRLDDFRVVTANIT